MNDNRQPKFVFVPRRFVDDATGASALSQAGGGCCETQPNDLDAAQERRAILTGKLRTFSSGKEAVARRGYRAFSLGEVLVALVLFVLLVVVVGQSINNNMRALAEMNAGGWDAPSMRAIREHILGITSRQQIEDGGEIELAGWPKPGDHSGTTAAQPTKVRWTAEVNPTSTLDLFTLTIDLQVDSSDDPIQASFILHVYRPGWGLPEDRERAVEAKLERLEAIRTARGEKRKDSQ